MNSQFEKIFPLLVKHRIDFIVIGGVAAIIHGSGRATFDVDVVYGGSEKNLKRLAEGLKPYSPLRKGLNFTLTTSLGDLDLLGEVTGGGGYEQLLPHTVTAEAFGIRFRCLSLEYLIKVKIAAGCPKDHEGVAELQAILRERGGKT